MKGARGIGGTPGKDLTVRVVTDLILQAEGSIDNLTFDNWYSSAKLSSLVTAMDIPLICTVRPDRVGKAPVMSTKCMEKQERGSYSYAYDDAMQLHCIKWRDNAVVTVLSNCYGPEPTNSVERYSRKVMKKVSIPQPKPIGYYNQAMGGVDLLDASVADYRITIRGKKWWWPHFINSLGVMMGAAWKIYRKVNPKDDQSLLYFVRSVVSSYLHRASNDNMAPQYWKCAPASNDAMRLTGRSHWPISSEKQRRCAMSCGSKVRTICEECDIALCVKGDCFKKYHTLKDIKQIS